MELIQNEALIARLEKAFHDVRMGIPVRGTEEIKRTWYVNRGVGKYQAFIELHGRMQLLISLPLEAVH